MTQSQGYEEEVGPHQLSVITFYTPLMKTLFSIPIGRRPGAESSP